MIGKLVIISVITVVGRAFAGLVFTTDMTIAQDIRNSTADYQDRDIGILGEVSEIRNPHSGRK